MPINHPMFRRLLVLWNKQPNRLLGFSLKATLVSFNAPTVTATANATASSSTATSAASSSSSSSTASSSKSNSSTTAVGVGVGVGLGVIAIAGSLGGFFLGQRRGQKMAAQSAAYPGTDMYSMGGYGTKRGISRGDSVLKTPMLPRYPDQAQYQSPQYQTPQYQYPQRHPPNQVHEIPVPSTPAELGSGRAL
ncbi:hypothetical protein B7494_g6135 [Chlorociboria aeruginascens]|nr:hypothetical protein B7494_g6135 [Chlorociboria aeruginascens]